MRGKVENESKMKMNQILKDIMSVEAGIVDSPWMPN